MLAHQLRRAAPKSAYPRYVGGASSYETGSYAEPGQISISLTSLTGGLASSPSAGDLVVVVIGSCGSQVADYDVIMTTSGYTERVELFASDTVKTNFGVFTKFMGATPDTTAVGASGFNSQFRVMLVQVWRGVNATTPMDVTLTSTTGTDGATVDAPSITPATPKSVVLAIGSAADVLTASNALSALTVPSGMTNFVGQDCFYTAYRVESAGIASVEWTGGAYNPAAFGGGSTYAGASWAAATLALRPA